MKTFSGAPLSDRLLALPTNIIRGWKDLPGTNVLETFVNYDRKSFTAIAPGACTIKLFTAVIYGIS